MRLDQGFFRKTLFESLPALTLGFLLLIMVGLSASPAMVSIGVGGLSLPPLATIITKRTSLKDILAKPGSSIPFSLLPFFFIQLLALAFTAPDAPISSELKTKLPFLILPLAWAALPALSSKHKTYLYTTFITAIALITFVTLIHYFLHFEEINASILQSKSVPIISLSKSISHIYFGFMACFAIGLCWAKELNWAPSYLKIGVSFFLAISLHIFAARTGLFTFYLALLTTGAILIFQRKISLRKITIGAMGLILLLVVTFFCFPSLQNRLQNTLEDWQVWKRQTGIGYYSLSNRLFVWRAGIEMVKENPWVGIGPAAIPEALARHYQTSLLDAPRESMLRDFHNQWLEYSVGLGIPLALILLFCFFYPLRFWRKLEQPILYAYFLSVLFFASLSESVLERQMGVAFFLTFQFLLTAQRDSGASESLSR